jgi:hypothetical protein
MPVAIDVVHGVLAFLAFIFLILWLVTWKAKGSIEGTLAALKSELASLKAVLPEQEYRVERHDLLWYPVLQYSPSEKKIVKVTVGAPHCPACFVPLKVGPSKNFLCPKCSKNVPESVTDLSVMDSIDKLVRSYFVEKRPEYIS